MKRTLTILSCLVLLLAFPRHVLGSPGVTGKPGMELCSVTETPPPGAGFTYTTNGGCAPVIVQFYSQLNGPSYAWTFGDGGTSSDCNPVHTYTTPGTYTITLVATGGTYTTTITVGAVPVVTFWGDSVSCQGDMKHYTVSSTIPAASYNWNPIGGMLGTNSATAADITWSSYGINYIDYTITTAQGCTKIFRYKVKVIPPPMVNLPCCEKRDQPNGGKPQHNEGIPGGDEPCSVCAGSYSCYQGSIDPLFGISSDYTWVWTVTNGTIISISPDSTKCCIVWGASGTGKIKLVITHKIYGCQTVRECNVVIKPGITPTLSITGTCVNTPVDFSVTLTTPLTDIDHFTWEFGDGYTQTTTDPFTTHVFAFTGPYTATVTIVTKEGCEYKVSQTFNIISGTRPTIECPGTACEGSRQCYTTTAIAGATYIWTVTGNATPPTISGNQVCVTWGSGPVGTVEVTVLGGGYTCTNTASVDIPIVASVIPISAPDYICQSSTFLEVSTTNYSGACYRWKINGVFQPSFITNKMTFNPSLYGSPILVEVEVDFGLGCCKGKGSKLIKRIPEYTMLPYTDACRGDIVTYTLFFPAGAPSTPVAWSVTGGHIISVILPNQVKIQWDVVGVGTITAGNNTPTQYCNDASNNTWNVNVRDKAKGEPISGPDIVCAGATETYYHGFSLPTGSAVLTATPIGGGPAAVVSPGTYSSDVTFPAAIFTPQKYLLGVTYHLATAPDCDTTIYDTVVVIPINIPIFSTIVPQCEGDIVTYTATNIDSNYYEWEVVGGTVLSHTYTGSNLSITVQWNSTINSTITVKNKACGTDNTQTVIVNGKPVVIITPSAVSCTSGGVVTLRVAPVWASYNWSTGSIANTTTVSSPGIYTVTISNGVCSNTGSINVPIVTPTPPNITTFTVTPSGYTICPKYNTICPTVIPGSGSITTYAWSFTGFTTSSSSLTCPAVALSGMPGPSTGTWLLTVTDSYGCKDTMSGNLTDSCIILPPDTGTTGDTPCVSVATFNITYDPCTGKFNDSGLNYISVFWDFGDNSIAYGLDPTHFYTTPCNKTVNCYVTDINGCIKKFTFTIAVPYVFYNVSLTNVNSPCAGTDSVKANGLYLCPGGGLTPTYKWFIRPVGSSTIIYSVTTSTPALGVGSIGAIPDGDYVDSVVITVSGCSRIVKGTFHKGGLKAHFVTCGGCDGSPISFTDQSIPYLSPLIKWEWTFSGPVTVTSFLQNPTVTLPAGTYTITLTVTDDVPCSHTYTVPGVIVKPPFVPVPPDIAVNHVLTAAGTKLTVCPGATYWLYAPGAGTGMYTYSWSTGSSADSIKITEQGDYYVTVFDIAGGCSKKVGPIKFRYKPAPEAIILYSGNQCSPRLLRAFTGVGYSYNWNYPVGMTSTQPYIYASTSGPVTLQVSNVHGCSSTTTQNFTVYPTPTAFITFPPPYCGTPITLNGNPSGGTPGYTHIWTNGSMASTTTANQPGVYKYKVTDANNCYAEAQINLQPQFPPGMDLLPHGCYEICGPVSFCTGLMPFGWTGQWYNGAVPFGGVIPQGGSIATTFSAPGTYTLHYTPVSPTFGCAAVSKPITITVVSLPPFTITAPTNPAYLCLGGSDSVLLHVDSCDLAHFTYTWYNGTTIVGTGCDFYATDSGTYRVRIAKNPCCYVDLTIKVIGRNCCLQELPALFHKVLAPVTYTTKTYWEGTWYIDDVVTVSGPAAELDITNVDCIFGRNGRIEVVNRAFLRTNNSVLRPCDKDSIWQGLIFNSDGTGWINTTTIKNAITAVDVQGNNVGVRLTDNSFIKCHTSVLITNSTAQQSISGNTFEIDESQLPYPVLPNEYWGIKMYSTDMTGLISQNEFRHVQPQNTANQFYGVYGDASSFTVSENHFNDMFRSVDVSNNINVATLERNTIKLNNLKTTYDIYQVRVTNCQSPVLIYENEMDNGLTDNSTANAIFCDNTIRTHIKDNRITGFRIGILGRRTTDINIATNEVTDATLLGIGVTSHKGSIISCNTINSMATNGGAPFGIIDYFGDGSASIYANCIYNMNIAIDIDATPVTPLPALFNNYMYNYTSFGIRSNNCAGNIGGPGGPTFAGRNTFMSNNGATGATFDIFAAPAITEGGNFGILLTSGVASTTGPDRFYSTAACSHQIQSSYPTNQLDKYNVCDNYNLKQWIDPRPEGGFELIAPDKAFTAEAINQALETGENQVIGGLIAMMLKGGTAATQTADAMLASKMDKEQAAWLIVHTLLAASENTAAAGYLKANELGSINADLRTVLETEIALANGSALQDGQVAALKQIDNSNTRYSSLAREVIQAVKGDHDYRFGELPEIKPEVKPENAISRTENNLLVYPVPASDRITVRYNVADASVKGIKVISAIGTEVTSFTYSYNAGEASIDITSLAQGVYTVMIITDNEKAPMRGRFIKIGK